MLPNISQIDPDISLKNYQRKQILNLPIPLGLQGCVPTPLNTTFTTQMERRKQDLSHEISICIAIPRGHEIG